MKLTRLGIFVGVMGMIALELPGSSAAVEPHEPSADTRQRLALTPAQRNQILTEMRQMLGSVSEIVQGLAADDLPAAEKAARMSGMMHAADADPQLQALLPQPFLALGIQTHRGFDTLADQIKAGGSQADILRGLAKLTGNCLACHATYQLDEPR